ncbi:MAG TPA: c-type cytochrome [Longimicrobiaceae bacterium]|nr:c-type cytochrome [Longimicrobiaceae bacterium]
MILSRIFRGAILAVALATLVACEGETPDRAAAEAVTRSIEEIDPVLLAALPPGTTPDALARGREFFVVCSVCHGVDGRGTQLGPSLRDTTWIHIDGSIEQIAEITRRGVEPPSEYPIPMPPMGGGDFDAEQLRAVATYVYALARSPG